MNIRILAEAFQIAVTIGVLIGFILDILFEAKLNIITLAFIIISIYVMVTDNEMFADIVERLKTGGK
ncbi:Uncharacterised protein [Niallia circulans]|uniref:hypothetical protein n=1 Tax=Niallia circulans TaxID=1397 RepID=UPI00077C499F|nr:hypothetical protein [Niallia circulans]MDR4318717.1 hypothetical protein [Niallia circulans]MED3839321.1 hypothetical protein [Niallia circulans]MED4245304.1 hypothetical protein [Niallia circulans]MED4250839.1 hypothetical protein [Niallia circulans]QKH60123.1 hypothetical protein FOC77_05370 [Niallia circulans]